jgi:hypothetical protein
MSLQTLDRTRWSFAESLAHVAAVTIARRAAEATKMPPEPQPAYPQWHRPDPEAMWKKEAENELLVALRDGDLVAQGRFTKERTHWGIPGGSTGFDLHSGYHTSIRPEEWREGRYSLGRLTALEWEFIDIRIPRFVVLAIWPDAVAGEGRPSIDDAEEIYTTPYLELMQAAIASFGITAHYQCKKELLSDWFLEQKVEGEALSQNLADAMATLIRQPSAQRGGAKRIQGPDLRRVG